MTAPESVDPAGFVHEQPEAASPLCVISALTGVLGASLLVGIIAGLNPASRVARPAPAVAPRAE